MESLETRINNVRKFLQNINWNLEYNIIPIYDDYGPTVTDESIQALVGSLETYNGCKSGIAANLTIVNEERVKIGFIPLEIFTVNLISSNETAVTSVNMQDKVSSSQIREYISKISQNEKE